MNQMPNQMPDELMELLQGLPPDELQAMLEPYQQEQSVLDQQMALAGQLRQQPQQEHASVGGALAGGLSGALGNTVGAYQQQQGLKGQQELGGRMQKQGAATLQTWLANALRKKKEQEGQQQMLDGINLNPAEMMGP